MGSSDPISVGSQESGLASEFFGKGRAKPSLTPEEFGEGAVKQAHLLEDLVKEHPELRGVARSYGEDLLGALEDVSDSLNEIDLSNSDFWG